MRGRDAGRLNGQVHFRLARCKSWQVNAVRFTLAPIPGSSGWLTADTVGVFALPVGMYTGRY